MKIHIIKCNDQCSTDGGCKLFSKKNLNKFYNLISIGPLTTNKHL